MLHRPILIAACLAASSTHAQPADPQWRVVAANNQAPVVLPSLLPATGTFGITRVSLADGDGALGLARQHDSAPHNLWVERAGTLSAFAGLLATGAQGPGRSGGEAGHVFRSIWYKHDGSVGPGRVFGARAGEPTQPADAATWGLWHWNGQRNNEIARLDVTGNLAPGFTAGIQFTSFGSTGSTTYPNAQALADGRALIEAQVSGGLKSIVLHTPGNGNQGCILESSTDPAWSPDIADAYFYDSGLSVIQTAIPATDGAVYLASAYRIGTSTSQRGIFRICDGAPRSLARSGVSGAFGPGMADSSATFSEFDRVRPGDRGGEVFFWGRGSGTAGNFIGGFHHANGLNRPLWLNDTEGAYGPGYSSYRFNQTSAPVLYAGGEHAVLNTTIRPAAGSTSVRGLWRLRPGQSPQPVAIVGDTGAYAPAAGRAWRSFATVTILDNGDILTVAEVSNPIAIGVWRLRPGAAPEAVLAVGDLVSVPTASGIEQRAVTSISASQFDDLAPRVDNWASRQGDVLVRANVQGISSLAHVYLRGRVSRPDHLFAHHFGD